MNIAISLLEAASGGTKGSRIITLMSGAVNYGPGKIVSQTL